MCPTPTEFRARRLTARSRTTATARRFALQGSVGGDAIELQGGYDGGLTAFSNPHVDLQLEGSALGALPAQLGFATRPIESYRIAAKVEERSDAPSPVNLDVTIENTRVRFEGNVDELRALKGIDGTRSRPRT